MNGNARVSRPRRWPFHLFGIVLMLATAAVTVYVLLALGDFYLACETFEQGMLAGFAVGVGVMLLVFALVGGPE